MTTGHVLEPDLCSEKFIMFKKTGDQYLREQLISENINIVLPITIKYKNTGEALEDLRQVGYIGLIKAVDHFDPSKGVKFSTYATHCIIGEIRHYIRDKSENIKRPRWLKKLNGDVNKYVESFVQCNSRLPSIKEIAEALNMSEAGVIEIFMSKKAMTVSLDSNETSYNQIDINRIKSIRHETFKLPVEDRIALEQAIEKLKELEKKIIYLFFYQDLTQTQIASDLGISQRKVSRMIHQVIVKLRESFVK